MWETPTVLDSASTIDTLQSAVNTAGDVVAAWRSYNTLANTYVAKAATKPSGDAWSTVTTLSDTTQLAIPYGVAINASGTAFVIWTWLYNNTTNVIQTSNKELNDTTWSTAVTLSSNTQSASNPQIVVDASGNATAIWQWHNGTNSIIQTSIKPTDSSWSAATTLSDTVQNASNPQLGIDSAGNTLAVWKSLNGSSYYVHGSYKPVGSSWSTYEALSDSTAELSDLQLKVSSSGNAAAVWINDLDVMMFSTGNVKSVSFIPAPTITSLTPSSGSTAGGEEIVIAGSNFIDVQSVFFGSTAATSFTVTSPTSITATAPNATAAGAVNVKVVTNHGESNTIAYTYNTPAPVLTSLTPSSGSTAGGEEIVIAGSNFIDVQNVFFGSTAATSFTVTSPTSITATAPNATAAGTVNVKVVTNHGESNTVHYAYVVPNIAAPTQFKGKVVKNRFAFQTEYVHKLSWKKSPAPHLAIYRLYRNGKLIKTFSPKRSFTFYDRNRQRGAADVYTLIAVDSHGVESSPIKVTVR